MRVVMEIGKCKVVSESGVARTRTSFPRDEISLIDNAASNAFFYYSRLLSTFNDYSNVKCSHRQKITF